MSIKVSATFSWCEGVHLNSGMLLSPTRTDSLVSSNEKFIWIRMKTLSVGLRRRRRLTSMKHPYALASAFVSLLGLGLFQPVVRQAEARRLALLLDHTRVHRNSHRRTSWTIARTRNCPKTWKTLRRLQKLRIYIFFTIMQFHVGVAMVTIGRTDLRLDLWIRARNWSWSTSSYSWSFTYWSKLIKGSPEAQKWTEEQAIVTKIRKSYQRTRLTSHSLTSKTARKNKCRFRQAWRQTV